MKFEESGSCRWPDSGRHAEQRQDFRWAVGELDERRVNFGGQRFKGREVDQVRIVLLDLFPEPLDRIEVGRIGRQLIDHQARGVLRKERFQRRARVIARAVLDQHDVPLGLRQDLREKLLVSRRIQARRGGLIEKAAREIVNQAEDLVALTHARGLDYRLHPAPRPTVVERAPLRKGDFVAKEQPGLASLGHAQRLRPGLPLPCARRLAGSR